jgi:hypothetical protein
MVISDHSFLMKIVQWVAGSILSNQGSQMQQNQDELGLLPRRNVHVYDSNDMVVLYTNIMSLQ